MELQGSLYCHIIKHILFWIAFDIPFNKFSFRDKKDWEFLTVQSDEHIIKN